MRRPPRPPSRQAPLFALVAESAGIPTEIHHAVVDALAELLLEVGREERDEGGGDEPEDHR